MGPSISAALSRPWPFKLLHGPGLPAAFLAVAELSPVIFGILDDALLAPMMPVAHPVPVAQVSASFSLAGLRATADDPVVIIVCLPWPGCSISYIPPCRLPFFHPPAHRPHCRLHSLVCSLWPWPFFLRVHSTFGDGWISQQSPEDRRTESSYIHIAFEPHGGSKFHT